MIEKNALERMKTNVQYLFLLLVSSITVGFAQTNVQLNIHHFMGESDFRYQGITTNNLNHEFDFTRLEYYIAEISLIHDGGQETSIPDYYILVDGASETTVELGEFDITNLEAIRFHVGVEEEANHSDPTAYPMDHPLAPRIPSMHWGWAFGYRFVAIEGNSGANLGQLWEIHALEDENYFQAEVLIERSAMNGQLTIDIDADYARALEDIDLDSGPIVHGGYDEARLTLENFQNHVFTASDLVSSTSGLTLANGLYVFPNPVLPGMTPQFVMESSRPGALFEVKLVNVGGQVVREFPQVERNAVVSISDLRPGVYFLHVSSNGYPVARQKLIVQ